MPVLAYAFDPGFIAQKLPDLGAGFLWTLAISAIGIAGSLAVGVLGGAARAARLPGLGSFAAAYVEVFRNTPLLVQIFFLYFALPEAGLRLSAFAVAWLSLVLWGGAYSIENFRAGFEAVPHGYQEAASALGLSRLETFALVTLPIGIRIALPSVTNTCISVFKNSSFMVAISFPELTDTAVNIVAVTFRVFEMFFTIGAVYLIAVWGLSVVASSLERRLTVPEAG